MNEGLQEHGDRTAVERSGGRGSKSDLLDHRLCSGRVYHAIITMGSIARRVRKRRSLFSSSLVLSLCHSSWSLTARSFELALIPPRRTCDPTLPILPEESVLFVVVSIQSVRRNVYES